MLTLTHTDSENEEEAEEDQLTVGDEGDEEEGSSRPDALVHAGVALSRTLQLWRFKGSGLKEGDVNHTDMLQNSSGSRSVLLQAVLHSSRNGEEERKHILGLLFSGFSTNLQLWKVLQPDLKSSFLLVASLTNEGLGGNQIPEPEPTSEKSSTKLLSLLWSGTQTRFTAAGRTKSLLLGNLRGSRNSCSGGKTVIRNS